MDNRSVVKRSYALDALRGIAIIGMVFSGVFPHESIWPGYMFHAQVGPPDFTYHPTIPGISWVDMVFPFFLFSMGAAFPLALKNKLQTGRKKMYFSILKRGGYLVFFAIVLQHTDPGFLKGKLWINYLTGLAVFGCFFLVFMRFHLTATWKALALKGLGLVLILFIIYAHNAYTPLVFNIFHSNIIIMVLANMAVFGAVIWVATRHNLLLRLGVLALFAAIWLTHTYKFTISEAIFNFHPGLDWFYRFEYLKYLNVIIPGTILGDLLARTGRVENSASRGGSLLLLIICLALLIINIYGLYTRQVWFLMAADTLVCLAGVWVIVHFKANDLVKNAFYWGVFLLLLGLLFEPLDGGIRKDPSSFSFWFVSSALAFFTFISCGILSKQYSGGFIWKRIVEAGQNPMVAYVGASFLVLPLFYFSGITAVFGHMKEADNWFSVVQAIVITLGVVAATSYTTRMKWLWRT